MSGNNKGGISIGEQVADLVQRKPQQNYDVIFSVGPQKIKVEAVKILLKAASPVFEREFDQNWEAVVVLEGEGIPLPHFEPEVFKLFVHLIISDTWSAEALNNLHLAPNTVLSLLGLCRHYKITKAIENLEKAVDNFIKNFSDFKDTSNFLKMPQKSLETILACEQLTCDEKEIFECVCKWAEHQCKEKQIETTGENFRKVLGSCFQEIRFPTMKLEDFTRISAFKKNLFTAAETVAIFQFIGTDDEDQKANIDKSQLPFKTNPRNSLSSSLSVLRLPKQFKIMKNPPFLCDGIGKGNHFQVNKKISLYGLGFLGPIEGDTQFDVTVQIRRFVSPFWTFDSGTLLKNIFARKDKIFYFLFDNPIIIEPNAYDSIWRNNYCIFYTLTGANNVSQFAVENPKLFGSPIWANLGIFGSKDKFVRISGVKFKLMCTWNRGSPLAELLFKQI